MQTFYVSLTYDLFGTFLAFEADSQQAVRYYLEAHYLCKGVWKLPWCSVYRTLPSGAATVIEARCGKIYEADYDYMKEVAR